MKWSKLKQCVEERFADSLAGRVEVYSTRYRDRYHDEEGRDWITVDKHEIANFPEQGVWSHHDDIARQLQIAANATDYRDPEQAPRYCMLEKTAWDIVHKQGVFVRWELNRALFDSLSLSVDDMLRSENGIIRALAMLDRRLGKRRLRALMLPDDELPLVRTLYALRCEAECITFAPTPG